jgi:hypothetical protein
MDNNEKLINEIFRSTQLMGINTEPINENKFNINFKNIWSKLRTLGKAVKDNYNNKLPFNKQLDVSISTIDPNSNDAQYRTFKNSYDRFLANPKDENLKYDVIYNYLDLNVPIQDKTTLLLRGLNISYSRLASYISDIFKINGDEGELFFIKSANNDPSQTNYNIKIFNNFLATKGISNPKEQKIYQRFYEIYTSYGSGRSKLNSVESSAYNMQNYLNYATKTSFFEGARLWQQTFQAIQKAWGKRKEELEIRIFDKYRAYLDAVGGAKTADEIANITTSYTKYIDSTYKAYLMRQEDDSMRYINLYARKIKELSIEGKSEKYKEAKELMQILDELINGYLSEKYPGFRLTNLLNTTGDASSKPNTLLSKAKNYHRLAIYIQPFDKQKVNNYIIQFYPNMNKRLKSVLTEPFFWKNIKRLFWGVSPNIKVLYELIKNSKGAIRDKSAKKLLYIYLTYVYVNLVIRAYLLVILPAVYTAYYFFGEIPFKKIFGVKFSERDKNLLSGGPGSDIVSVLGDNLLKHIQETMINNRFFDEDRNFGLRAADFASNFLVPPFITSFNSSIFGKISLYFMNSIYGDERNNYSTFSNALLAVLVGHSEKVKSEASQIEVIQAGGTGVSLNTYKYSKFNEVEGKVNYLINFQHNKTKELKVNLTDTESGETKDHTILKIKLFSYNNNILLRLAKKYKINKMAVVDNTGKEYEIVAK